MEHVAIDSAEAVTMLRALEGTPTKGGQILVRLPWNDPIMKRVLDGGATTVMFPFIENVEEASRGGVHSLPTERVTAVLVAVPRYTVVAVTAWCRTTYSKPTTASAPSCRSNWQRWPRS